MIARVLTKWLASSSFLKLYNKISLVRLLLEKKCQLKLIDMKKFYAPLIMFLAFVVATDAHGQEQDIPKDSTLLSESVEGNYLVRRYMISNSSDEAAYNLSYSIAASKLPSLTVGNVAELVELDELMAKIKGDNSMRISKIDIIGYASPDGNAASNEALAMSRAQEFRTLLESRYGLSSSYDIQVKADAEPWSACDQAVNNSSIEEKAKVLAILNSASSENSKEQDLKAMPEVWRTFRTEILPTMRRVDMTIYYNVDTIVEVRTLIEKPKPAARATKQQCCCAGFVDDETIGIVVDMSDPYAIY